MNLVLIHKDSDYDGNLYEVARTEIPCKIIAKSDKKAINIIRNVWNQRLCHYHSDFDSHYDRYPIKGNIWDNALSLDRALGTSWFTNEVKGGYNFYNYASSTDIWDTKIVITSIEEYNPWVELDNFVNSKANGYIVKIIDYVPNLNDPYYGSSETVIAYPMNREPIQKELDELLLLYKKAYGSSEDAYVTVEQY